MDKPGLNEMGERAVALNRDAFAGEEYNIAYHALMAAFLCGERLGDIKLLIEVERLAKKQGKYIDDHHPECTHSSKAAQERGKLSIFRVTANQARMKILMLEQRRT